MNGRDVARPKLIGRYAIYGEIAAGGMATVHLGRLLGPVGFSRTVAIKRLHPQLAKDPEFVQMFLDEARLASRIRHPNVVSTLDIVAEQDELFVVMDYVHGESLARVLRAVAARGERMPPRIVSGVLVATLNGLHAAHEARDEQGRPLDLVHRDVSPQNVLVGADGVARVIDFGVAKAAGASHQTREGQLKGKLPYMAPEQFKDGPITRRVDVYAASIVVWESLTGRRLIKGSNEAAIVERVLFGDFDKPSELVPDLPKGLDEILARGLSRAPDDRFASARELATALERCVAPASMNEIAEWVGDVVGSTLAERALAVAAIESAVDPSAIEAPRAIELREASHPLPALDDAGARTALTSVTDEGPPTSPSEDATSTIVQRPRKRGLRPLALALGVGAATIGVASALVVRSAPTTVTHEVAPSSTSGGEPSDSPSAVVVAAANATAEPSSPPPIATSAQRGAAAAQKQPRVSVGSPPVATSKPARPSTLPPGLPAERD